MRIAIEQRQMKSSVRVVLHKGKFQVIIFSSSLLSFEIQLEAKRSNTAKKKLHYSNIQRKRTVQMEDQPPEIRNFRTCNKIAKGLEN